jgi:transposase
LEVHVASAGVGFSVSNEAAGYAALVARLRPLRVKRIVLGATGGYERTLWLALSEAGLVAWAFSAAVLTAASTAPCCPGSGRRRHHLSTRFLGGAEPAED